MLTELHWAAPRPVSRAEGELSAQLGGWEHGAGQLEETWHRLRKRLDGVLEKQRAKVRTDSRCAGCCMLLMFLVFVRCLLASTGRGS